MRPEKLPEAVGSLVPTSHKILAWATHRGGHIIATNRALLSTDAHEPIIVPWGNTVAARWNEPLLTVFVQDDLASQPRALAWMLDEPGMVPSAVHDRVTDANLVDISRDIEGVGTVRFIARRGESGITWTTLIGDSTNTTDQQTQLSQTDAISAELANLRSTLGI